MKISILVGTRDRPVALRRCLHSISQQRLKSYETIVFDDASSETNVEAVVAESEVDLTEMYRSKTPVGVAEMRNRLVAGASGEICFFIDDDAYLPNPDSLARLEELFNTYSKTAAVATRIIDRVDGEDRVNVPFPRTTLLLHPTIAKRMQRVSYFIGAAHAIRRDVFEECGGYASFLHFGESELDLSYRLLKCGYDIRYTPDIRIVHHPGSSVLQSEDEESELFYHTRNRIYLAWRYIPTPYILPYLMYWTVVYGGQAVRKRALRDVVRGGMEGLCQIRNWSREPIADNTIAYLRAHHGRLWR